MSSNGVNVSTLVNAVGSERGVSPEEKETSILWTKDGNPTKKATRFDTDVARVFSQEAGIVRRWLQHPEFTAELIWVTNSSGKREVEPLNYTSGRITAVKGYLPVDTQKTRASSRSTGSHADYVSFDRSGSTNSYASLKLPTPVSQQTQSSSSNQTQPSVNTGKSSQNTVDGVEIDDPLKF